MAIQNDLYSQFQRNRVISQTQSEEVQQENIISTQPKNSTAAYQQYQNSMVNTASPQDLTLMLFNGLVKFLNLSVEGIAEKSIEKTNINILKAQAILIEFMGTLDMNYEVSQGLFSLYDFMNNRLIKANIGKDKAMVEEVLVFAEELRDTWAQAMKLAKQSQIISK